MSKGKGKGKGSFASCDGRKGTQLRSIIAEEIVVEEEFATYIKDNLMEVLQILYHNYQSASQQHGANDDNDDEDFAKSLADDQEFDETSDPLSPERVEAQAAYWSGTREAAKGNWAEISES